MFWWNSFNYRFNFHYCFNTSWPNSANDKIDDVCFFLLFCRTKKDKKKKKKKKTEIPCNVCLYMYEKTLSFGKIKTNISKCRHLIFVPTYSIICVDCPLTVILIHLYLSIVFIICTIYIFAIDSFFLQFANCKLR